MTLSLFVPSYTAFDGHRRLASGALETVALAVRRAADDAASGPIAIFDDATGRTIDLDLRGTADDVRARYAAAPAEARAASEAGEPGAGEQRGRGRPKLGV
ncbi:DUF2239 family protein, partial [Burkholderia vietnamiensis]